VILDASESVFDSIVFDLSIEKGCFWKHRYDDLLPPNPNQKATKYPSDKIRTRLTPENRNQFRDNLKEFGQNKDLVSFYDVQIRGQKGDVYYHPETRLCIGIKIDSDSGERILTKAQPVN
jgi:hypothetical protein